MNVKQLFLLLLVSLSVSFLSAQNLDKQKVLRAAEQHRRLYPEATLQDFYKCCFQDAYGPEHLLADTPDAYDRSRQYLVREGEFLHQQHLKTTGIPYYESVGYRGDFYRVSLELIEDGIVPFDAFFLAFQHSIKEFAPPSLEAWKAEWHEVLQIVADLHFPNYDNDVKTIDKLLAEGQFAYYHSKTFNQTYQPHYRLMAKSVFEKEILPYCTQSVPYEVCQNYFVHNDVNEVPRCIYSQEEFSRYFGMAAFMGKGGEVTPIDFNESFVIAVAPEAGYNYVELKPFLLQLSSTGLYYCYEKTTGPAQTYESRPVLLIKVAKKYRLPVTVGTIENTME